jgi:hypothetical protein
VINCYRSTQDNVLTVPGIAITKIEVDKAGMKSEIQRPESSKYAKDALILSQVSAGTGKQFYSKIYCPRDLAAR